MPRFSTSMKGPEAVAVLESMWDKSDAIDNRIYPGMFNHTSLPALRPDGSAIQNGDQLVADDGYTYSRIGGAWVNQTAAASASAAAALASKNAAVTSEANAAGDAADANLAKVGAEAARDSIVLSSGAAATIALGRATVADGQPFLVRPNNTDGLTRTTLYIRNSSTTQTKVTDYGAGSEIDALKDLVRISMVTEYFSVRDGSGFSRFVGNDTGFGTLTEWIGAVGVKTPSFDVVATTDGFGVRDQNGYYIFRVGSDGRLLANLPDVATLQSQVADLQSQLATVEALQTAIGSASSLELIAHRGFAMQAPENTLLAWSSALARGADSLETDVSVSSDGVLYLFHDPTVDALTFGSGTFTALSAATIDALRFRSTAGTPLAEARIAKFTDMLAYGKQMGCLVYPEFKAPRSLSDIDIIVQAVVDAGMEDLCIFQSFTLSHLQRARSINTKVRLAYLVSVGASYATYADQAALLGKIDLAYDASAIVANPTMVAYCKSKNVGLVAWTVDDANLARTLLALGVNRIMSNYSLKAVL